MYHASCQVPVLHETSGLGQRLAVALALGKIK